MDKFGEYIRELRLNKGWNQTILAAKLRIDSGFLSKCETGKKEFKPEHLKILAEIFSLDLDELKKKFFGEKIANVIYKNNCPDDTLKIAEKEIKYLKKKNTKQSLLKK